MPPKETSISYLLRAFDGKSKVKDHLKWQVLGERHKPLQDASERDLVFEPIKGKHLYHTGSGNNYMLNLQIGRASCRERV